MVLDRHKSWMENTPPSNKPLPMKLAQALEHGEVPVNKKGDIDLNKIKKLEDEFSFQYRSPTG